MSLTNIGLVEHCKKALNEGWGYVYGTYGQILNENLLQAKLKQYPENIINYINFIRDNWIGKRVTDCVGLIKSYIWWTNNGPAYNPKTDVSANGMYLVAKEKGDIKNIPEIPGICVHRDGHIGVYIGNGQVIESKGTKYGVVKTPLKGTGSNNWQHWLKCPYIEYVEPIKELTFEEALKIVSEAIDTPYSFWEKRKEIDPAFPALIIKFGKYIKGELK